MSASNQTGSRESEQPLISEEGAYAADLQPDAASEDEVDGRPGEDSQPNPQGQSPFRSDATQAITDEELDPFGHRDYAATIEAALKEVPSQFTLGLFGPWGSGKSTILGEVKRRANGDPGSWKQRWSALKDWRRWRERRRDGRANRPTIRAELTRLVGRERRPTVLAIFDAWRYDGDSLRREFIRAVAEQLRDAGVLPWRFSVEKEVEAFEVDVTKPRETAPRLSWATFVYGVLSALIVGAAIAGLYGALAVIDPGDKTRVKAEIALLAPLAAFALVVAGRMVSPVQLQEGRRRPEFPEQFMSAFRALLDKARADQVVIAVDNLDRCSPKRVAEMLTTIKTFLEPALDRPKKPGAKKLCFIIAADDEALRRHLIAEEAAASQTTAGNTRAEEVAREAVDEYLRKFFNGTIRISELLDEDMLVFAKRELSAFVAWRGIDEPTEARLVELIAHRLRKNPRRIKQFVNNLELRLRLFSERRRANRILVDPDVMVVAKLAILEEDFHDDFFRLQQEPSLLEAWHRQAETKDPGELDQKLVGFLRFTNQIRTPYIAAYLTLKQTEAELKLPGYGEFVEQLEESNVRGLEALTKEMSPENLAKHVSAARRRFDLQLERRAWSSAHGIARSVIEVPSLGGEHEELSRHVFDRSISYYELKQRLLAMPASTVVERGLHSLSAARAPDLIGALIESVEGADVPAGETAKICDALEAHADELNSAAKVRLAESFKDEVLNRRFAEYSGLAEAVPEIIHPQSLNAAVQELAEAEDFNAEDPRFRVALANRRRIRGQTGTAQRLLAAVRQPLEARREAASAEFSALATPLVPVAMSGGVGDGSHGLAHDVAETWDRTAPDAHWPSLELARAACAGNEEADDGYGEQLGNRVFDAAGQGAVAQWIKKHLASMGAQFKAGLLARLDAGLAENSEQAARFLKVAKEALPENELGERIETAAREALEARNYGAFQALLFELDEEVSKDHLRTIAERAQNEPLVFLQSAPESVEILSAGQLRLPVGVVESVVETLISTLIDHRDLTPTAGPPLGELRLEDARRREKEVRRLIDFEREVEAVERREGILRCAYLLAGRPASNARRAIQERINEIRDHGENELAVRIAGQSK